MHMIVKTEAGLEQLQANLEITTFLQICNAVNAPNSVCLFLQNSFVYLSCMFMLVNSRLQICNIC